MNLKNKIYVVDDDPTRYEEVISEIKEINPNIKIIPKTERKIDEQLDSITRGDVFEYFTKNVKDIYKEIIAVIVDYKLTHSSPYYTGFDFSSSMREYSSTDENFNNFMKNVPIIMQSYKLDLKKPDEIDYLIPKINKRKLQKTIENLVLKD